MAVIMCHVRCVYEPVAVEVGEERLGLACVRVTVEHSSCKMAPALCPLLFTPLSRPPTGPPRPKIVDSRQHTF